MRIGLDIGDGRVVWLAGQAGISERDFSSASGLRVEGSIALQEDSFIRAAAVEVTDRKNLKTTISFGTVRKFKTVAEAEAFALDYDRSFGRTGKLIMESLKPGGGVSRRYLKGAVVSPPGREVTGVSVKLDYTVTGGSIS